MNRDTTQQIVSLSGLNKQELLDVWRENFSQAPPPKLRKELMVPIIAYRIQEKEYGGLSQSARRRLKEIAQSLAPEKRLHTSLAPSLRTGTRLVRSWKGEVHEVTVSSNGFEYRGQQFNNLSVIARQITGTRWSGPLFFGTKRKAS